MKHDKIDQIYARLCDHITQQRLKQALDILQKMIVRTHSSDLLRQWEQYNQTYEYLLKYTIEGVDDPQREMVYRNLRGDVLELADNTREQLLEATGIQIYRMRPDMRTEEEAKKTVDELTFGHELEQLIQDNLSPHTQQDEASTQDMALQRIFRWIWLSNHFHEAEINLINSLRTSSTIPWQDKSLIVSAITLSMLRIFDKQKATLLLSFYSDREQQVWQRALVGLVFTLYKYDDRLKLYPDLQKQIDAIKERGDLSTEVETTVMQILRTRETEEVTRKLQEEIMPEVMKHSPKLKEKLDLDNLLEEDSFDDKNPDWHEFLEDSPELMGKLEELSEMQRSGADVFMSAFSMLKHFPFFNEISNWFIPFYSDNQKVIEALRGYTGETDPARLVDGLAASPFICNSDKYSFCFNVSQLPAPQRKMMLEMFGQELNDIKDLETEDNLLHQEEVTRGIITQYVQDLYRFFKLHPLKEEFDDIFGYPLQVHNKHFFDLMVEDEKALQRVGGYLFNKDYYEDALEVLRWINRRGDNSLETFEKIAYCYQRMGDFRQALTFYKKAELYGTNRIWHLKKMAWCHRQLQEPQEALQYYSEAAIENPDDLQLQAHMGHCYLAMKDYENALKHYYQVEFLAPDNTRIRRPIAWCLFVTGKANKAREYFTQLLDDKPTRYDYMNMGHIEWCTGDARMAIEYYARSIKMEAAGMDKFMESFEEDRLHLIKQGVKPNDIPIVLDYLRYYIKKGL